VSLDTSIEDCDVEASRRLAETFDPSVIDGSKALRRAVGDVFDRPVIQRCQLHYADVIVMPTLVVNPLVVGVSGLLRSA
jgi:hypothetical protein